MKETGTRSNDVVAVATIGACVAMMLVLIVQRGIWLDEGASFLFSWNREGIVDAARLWITDVHPPLFSAYAWALAPFLGENVQQMRLINLSGLVYAGLIWRQAWRGGLDRDFLLLLAVLTVSTPFAMLYAAEFRSYFLLLALGACLIVQLRRLDENMAGWGWLTVTTVLLINLHYFGSLVGLILLGVEALRLRSTWRPKAARAVLGIMILSVLPLALSLAATLSVISPVAVNEISALDGLKAIAAITAAAALNVAALALCRLRLCEASFAQALAGALVAIVVSYFLLNLGTRNLLPRHMIAAVPVAAAVLAYGLSDRVKIYRWAMPLICANALLLAAGATWHGLSNKRWETNVGRIEAAKATCPESRLYGFNAMSLLAPEDKLHSVPHINDIFAATYMLIAQDAELPVIVIPDGKAVRPGRHCPALLWVEHFYARQGISDQELARIAGFVGPIRVERLQRGNARALLAIRSADH